MALKRYTTEELIELCEDLFYNYMIEGDTFYAPRVIGYTLGYGETVDCSESNPCCMLYKQYLRCLETNKNRIVDLGRAIHVKHVDKSYQEMIRKQLEFLYSERSVLEKLNMSAQKEIYENSQDLKYSNSIITFPLNKLINSLYDDLWVEVLFFDDICTPYGKLAELLSTPKEKQKEFLKRNIEITHIGLVFKISTPTVIVLKGNKCDKTGVHLNVLPSKFGDFQNLRLKDLNSFSNNDLRQIFQSKIDLDKENLQLLAEESIRGDRYWLYYDGESREHWVRSGFYIRYICSSTGRVYYNSLNLQNLAISKYFNRDDYNSYLKAWWSITHLGASVEGKPVISC